MEIRKGYKQTEVGVIPEDWEVRPLLATVRVANGQVDPKLEPYRSMILVAPDHIESGSGRLLQKQTAMEQQAISGKYLFSSGDIIYSKIRPYLRKAILANFSGLCSADMYPLRPAADVSAGFILATLLGHHFSKYAESVSVRSGMPKINRAELAEYQVALPPTKTEQTAIAAALSDADALITSLEKLIAKKRNIKQGAMQELLRPKEGWVVKRLGELLTFSGGYSASRDQLSNEGFCYLHYGDIHGAKKTFINVKSEYIEIPKLKISLKNVSPKSLLNDGDIVFVDASEDDEGTSRHIVAKNPDGIPYISGLHTIVAKSKDDSVNNEYKRYCFQGAHIKNQFKFYAVGTKVSGISKTNIAKIEISLPMLEEQTRIAAILSDMDAEIVVLEKKLEKYRQIKQGMMQELLTGRIRLVCKTPKILQLPVKKESSPVSSKHHNWQINEAVVIAVLAKHFGSEQYPLPRKRCTKLTYFLHRHVEHEAEGYLKKAAGPYNPRTRYGGPETIAQNNGYIRSHHNGTYEGFVAADNIEEAEAYFAKWYGPDALNWLERFRFEKTDKLELLATVDMAMGDLSRACKPVDLKNVKQFIHDHPEWKAKLERDVFSDFNIVSAIRICRELFA